MSHHISALAAQPRNAVRDGFGALQQALADEARNPAEIDRAGAYRKALLKLEERWFDGAPPHTVRTPKAAPAQEG